MPVIDFDPPERFIADSVGPAGQRTFFVQAVAGLQVMTAALEKEQVRLLGESVIEMLDEMASDADADDDLADQAAQERTVLDSAPLQTPIEEDFRVRRLSLAWDPNRRRVVIEASDAEEDGSEEEGSAESTSLLPEQGIRVVLPVGMARGFAERCAEAITGGRPNCPFCGGPLDPSGHICPRANGYRR